MNKDKQLPSKQDLVDIEAKLKKLKVLYAKVKPAQAKIARNYLEATQQYTWAVEDLLRQARLFGVPVKLPDMKESLGPEDGYYYYFEGWLPSSYRC